MSDELDQSFDDLFNWVLGSVVALKLVDSASFLLIILRSRAAPGLVSGVLSASAEGLTAERTVDTVA